MQVPLQAISRAPQAISQNLGNLGRSGRVPLLGEPRGDGVRRSGVGVGSECSLARGHPINANVSSRAPQSGVDQPCVDSPAGPHCLVVMYHYVHDRDPLSRPGSAGPYPGVHALGVSAFRAQLDRLSMAGEPIDWPTFYAWTTGKARIPDRCFLLTFDDGLIDHAETVLPILEDRGLRGVFFVPTSVLTTRRMLPAHQVHLLLSILDAPEFELELRRVLEEHGGTMWCEGLDPDSTQATHAQTMYHYETPTLARLKYLLTMELPADVRSAALDKLFELHVGSSTRWSRHWYLGWDDVANMQALGHTIGGHGHLHQAYSTMTSEEIRFDVRQAADVLREGLGPEIRPFSYPYGSYTNAAVAACQDLGFVHAFTTHPRWADSESDPHRLSRVDTVNANIVLQELQACR